jgi:hypothetical protein
MKFRSLLIFSICLFPFLLTDISPQTFQTGEIAVSMNNYGRVRVIKDSLAGVRQIDRSSFLAGVASDYVFSYLLSAEAEDSMKNVINPQLSDFEIYGSINNEYDNTGESPDFLVKHNVYGWTGGGYILVKFTVINRESNPLTTVLGMEMLAQIDGSYGLESVEYLSDTEIIALYRMPGSAFVGYKILSHPIKSLKIFEWYDGYNNINSDLFEWLTYGQIDNQYDSGGDGAVSVFSKEEVTIAAGDSAIMWVGISVGDDEAEMVASMSLAEAKYQVFTGIQADEFQMPSAYMLTQNYPNPFNPSTTIRFSIPQQEFVSLKVYDILGTRVADLVNEVLPSGSYQVNFSSGSIVSGIYFYQLITGNYSETKKMNFIK